MQRQRYYPIPEKIVQKLLVSSLRRQGYQVVEQCLDDPTEFDDITECATSNIFGIDVVAQKGDVLWIIEVKGQPKDGRYCEKVFKEGISQLEDRITNKAWIYENGIPINVSSNIHFGLAIPNTDMFVPVARKFTRDHTGKERPKLRLLNESILLIQEDGSIELLGSR